MRNLLVVHKGFDFFCLFWMFNNILYLLNPFFCGLCIDFVYEYLRNDRVNEFKTYVNLREVAENERKSSTSNN